MMRFVCVCVLVWLWLLVGANGARAQQKSDVQPKDSTINAQRANTYEQQGQYEQTVRNSASLEIDGLVVDETITKIGRDFYDIFLRQWETPPMVENFTILIQEKPTRGNGALVSVSVNDENVLEYQLQPKYDLIEDVANYTVSLVYQYLLQDQMNKQLEAEGKGEKELF